MSSPDAARNLIDRIIACDDQPQPAELSELRGRLRSKVLRMKGRGHFALLVCLLAAIVIAVGVALVGFAVSAPHEIRWLTWTGFGFVVVGAILEVAACVGLLVYRGFGFVWARNDYQETAILDLTLQVQRLAEQVEALSKHGMPS
jgi:hypothetical protein